MIADTSEAARLFDDEMTSMDIGKDTDGERSAGSSTEAE